MCTQMYARYTLQTYGLICYRCSVNCCSGFCAQNFYRRLTQLSDRRPGKYCFQINSGSPASSSNGFMVDMRNYLLLADFEKKNFRKNAHCACTRRFIIPPHLQGTGGVLVVAQGGIQVLHSVPLAVVSSPVILTRSHLLSATGVGHNNKRPSYSPIIITIQCIIRLLFKVVLSDPLLILIKTCIK